MAQLMLGILLFAFGFNTLVMALREAAPRPTCRWDNLALGVCRGFMGVGAWVVLITVVQWFAN